MRLNRRSLKPVLESFESRDLLSGWSIPPPPGWLGRASTTKVIVLDGTTHGHYVQNTFNPDLGSVVSLERFRYGDGFRENVSASLHSVGFIANGSTEERSGSARRR